MKKSKIKSVVEKEFFAEIDRQKLTGNCSVLFVLLSLVLIFMIVISLLILVKQSNGWPKINQLDITLPGLRTKSDQQAEKSSRTIRLSEKELGQALELKTGNFPLRDPNIKILPDYIAISGKTGKSFFSLKTEADFKPEINAEGQIVFKFLTVKSMGIAAPKMIVDRISADGDGYLNDHISQLIGPAKNITLFKGYMEVELQ